MSDSVRCRICAGDIEVEANLQDTPLARIIAQAMPLEAKANTWGDEIYFTIPVDAEPVNLQETVSMGDLAYWQPGRAFCIFFGPTPMSGPNEIRPASGVEVFGNFTADPAVLKKVPDGARVTVELI